MQALLSRMLEAHDDSILDKSCSCIYNILSTITVFSRVAIWQKPHISKANQFMENHHFRINFSLKFTGKNKVSWAK